MLSEVIPDLSELCLLSEEWKSVCKNPQHTLVLQMFVDLRTIGFPGTLSLRLILWQLTKDSQFIWM